MYWRAPLSLITARARVLERADMTGSSFITTDELDQFIHDGTEKLHTLLVTLNQDLLEDTLTKVTVAGTAEYTVTTPMYQLVGIKLVLSSDEVPLHPYDHDRVTTTQRSSWDADDTPRYKLRFNPSNAAKAAIKFDPPPGAVYTYKVTYIPGPTSYTASSDIVLPFPDYYILQAAISCLAKEKTDSSDLRGQLERVEQQIRMWASPVDREPGHIYDARSTEDPWEG